MYNHIIGYYQYRFSRHRCIGWAAHRAYYEELQMRDPVEHIVEQALIEAKVRYTRNEGEQRLDFFLPDFHVWIECKQFYTERVSNQLRGNASVILIQSIAAAHAFACMIKPKIEG